MLMRLQISILHYSKKTIICHSHTKQIWKAVLAVFFLNKFLVSLKCTQYFPYLPKCSKVLFLALCSLCIFLKYILYTSKMRMHLKKPGKTLIFWNRDCFIQVGGRIKATLKIWLSFQMKLLKMQVKMYVLMLILIFCQEINKETDFCIRGSYIRRMPGMDM